MTARLQTLPGLRRRRGPPAGAGRLRHPCPYLSPGHAGHHPEPGGAARFDLQTHHDPRGEVGAPRVAGLQVGSGRLTAISLDAVLDCPGLIDHLDGRAVDQARVEAPDPGAAAYLQGPGAQPAHRVDTDMQPQVSVLDLGEPAGHREPIQEGWLGAHGTRLDGQGKVAQVLAASADQLFELHGAGRLVLDEEPQHESVKQPDRLPHEVAGIGECPSCGAAEPAGEVGPLPVSGLGQTNQIPAQASSDQAPTHRLRGVGGQLRQGVHLRQEAAGIRVRAGAPGRRACAPGVDLLIQDVHPGRGQKHREGPGGQ